MTPAWIVGTAARVDVPGHGSYAIAVSDPKAAGGQFAPNVIASGNSLTWSMDGDDIEITSQANVLTGSFEGNIWVYRDPNFRTRAADTVLGLLP
ncbi:MAG TPA: hypothetical protein VME17_12870 [Bryobacteraceae bacterium]|nr:hypothetical protein [Bryobacteraceae bacterium]